MRDEYTGPYEDSPSPSYEKLQAESAAQAQRIAELEEELQRRIPIAFADALEQERGAAILRAEVAEAQVKAMLGALTTERALWIARRRSVADTWEGREDAEALRTYAAVAKGGKE